MNIFKKLKLLKALNNKTTIFYKAGKRWVFETELRDPQQIALMRKFLTEENKKGN